MSAHIDIETEVKDKAAWAEALRQVWGNAVEVHDVPIAVEDYHGKVTHGDIVVRVNYATGIIYSPLVVDSATGRVTVDNLGDHRMLAHIERAVGVTSTTGPKALAKLAATVKFETNAKKKGYKIERVIEQGTIRVRASR